MITPVRWTQEQLASDAVVARNIFRRERLEEPLDRWLRAFDHHDRQFRGLLQEHGLAHPANLTAERVAQIFKEHLDGALRYFAAPPISEDDLQVLVEAASRVTSPLIFQESCGGRARG